MATASAKSVLTSTQRGLLTLANKVKSAVERSTGHKVEYATCFLGVERNVDLASSIVVEVYVLADYGSGYAPAYASDKDVMAGVKRGTGCRSVTKIGSSTANNPKGEIYQFDCSASATMTNTYTLPPVAFV